MQKKRGNYYASFGVSLLELMFSLAVISIIVVLSVRYFEGATSAQKMSTASNMVSAVRAAMRNFHNDNGGNATNLPTIQALVNASYLPAGFKDGVATNPWGGNIGIQAAETKSDTCTSDESSITSTYAICLDGFPSSACQTLSNKIASTLNLTGNQNVTGCAADGTGTVINVVLQY